MTDAAPIYLPPDGGLIGLREGRAVRLEPADLAAEAAILAIVPGEDVLCTDAELPPVRQASRRFQAARYALEDRLAAPVETLHMVLGPRGLDGRYPVAVVDLQRMDAWLDNFGDDRARVTAGLLPDYLCLPIPEDGASTLWLLDGRALIRHDRHHGFACESALVPALLGGEDSSRRLQVRCAASEDADALLQRLRDQGHGVDVQDRPSPDALLADLLGGAPARPPMNLLQQRYAPVSAADRWWRPLRATAVLAAVWLGLAVAAQGMHYLQLQSELERLQTASESRFREAFPGTESINDMRLQAEQAIRALRAREGTDGLFPLLATTTRAAGGVPGLRFGSLQYRNGELFLSLRGESVQTLEQLRAGFAEAGGAQLNVQSADASSDGVDIRARVSPEGT